jgi:hypothetical protein
MDSIPLAELLRGIGDWSAVPIQVGMKYGSEPKDNEDEIDLSSISSTVYDLLGMDTASTLIIDDINEDAMVKAEDGLWS